MKVTINSGLWNQKTINITKKMFAGIMALSKKTLVPEYPNGNKRSKVYKQNSKIDNGIRIPNLTIKNLSKAGLLSTNTVANWQGKILNTYGKEVFKQLKNKLKSDGLND